MVGGLFEITLSANCNNVEKTEPRKHEFGEVFGIKIGSRSKDFLFKIDTKIEPTFDNVFLTIFIRFGGPRWRQDDAKTRPSWLQDAASNLALFQEASKTPSDLDFDGFWTLRGSIFE